MSLFTRKLMEACKEKKLIKLFMHNGMVYTGFIKDMDSNYLEISYLDVVSNSDLDKASDTINQLLLDGEYSDKALGEAIKDIDYIFCDSIVKVEMIEKVDFNVVHGLRTSTAQYANHFKDNELKPAINNKTRRVIRPIRVLNLQEEQFVELELEDKAE